MVKLLWAICFCVLTVNCAMAQEFDFPSGAATDNAVLSKSMPTLATKVIAVYKEADQEKYLDNLLRLQIVAGQYSEANRTLKSLRDTLRVNDPIYADATYVQYEIYSTSKQKQTGTNLSFEDVFSQTFRDTFSLLNDKLAYRVASFNFDLASVRNDIQQILDQQKNKQSIAIADAIALVRAYQPYLVYKDILPFTAALVAQDDERRYDIQSDVLIKTKQGATISAVIYRKKGVTAPQPTALSSTIYAIKGNFDSAKLGAAHGDVGMIVYSRGKALSPDSIDPYEHEAQDGYDIIDWISKQPWSNGQVGMYGGSYNGFTQWRTKKLHPALKTIVPYVAAIPGLGLPMANNIFLNANYAWTFYVTDNKYLDNETYNNRARWDSLNDKWYASGKPYRQYDSVDGEPNKWLQRWLQHPSYDKYWQDMVPFQQDFANINIPVLTFTGYYDDGQILALHYLREHYKYNKNADHYLLIGPWDHFGSQRSRNDRVLRDYTIDPVAQIDTPEITFQWLDYVMRGGKKPEILKDKINFEVMVRQRMEARAVFGKDG